MSILDPSAHTLVCRQTFLPSRYDLIHLVGRHASLVKFGMSTMSMQWHALSVIHNDGRDRVERKKFIKEVLYFRGITEMTEQFCNIQKDNQRSWCQTARTGMHLKKRRYNTQLSVEQIYSLTQAGFPVVSCDHERSIAAVRAALNVKISKQEAQHPPRWHTKPPLTWAVHGIGARVVLRGQGARLCAQNCMPTAITWIWTGIQPFIV